MKEWSSECLRGGGRYNGYWEQKWKNILQLALMEVLNVYYYRLRRKDNLAKFHLSEVFM
jgi:hypothetical protein